jgi:hypothetical protein
METLQSTLEGALTLVGASGQMSWRRATPDVTKTAANMAAAREYLPPSPCSPRKRQPPYTGHGGCLVIDTVTDYCPRMR